MSDYSKWETWRWDKLPLPIWRALMRLALRLRFDRRTKQWAWPHKLWRAL